MSVSEIHALISLIEDPDESIFSHVKQKLSSYGEQVIPHLEHCCNTYDYGQLYASRIAGLIKDIHSSCLYKRLEAWVDSEEHDLLEAMLILNRYQFPDSDEDELRRQVNALRQDIWLELSDNFTAFESIRIVNHMFYDHMSFSGDRSNYADPLNCFLTTLLEDKKGNPLSLALLYQVLCNSLEIPVYGVNLPNHVVLCYLNADSIGLDFSNAESVSSDVLFYINPFANGELMMRSEIDDYLQGIEVAPETSYYRPCGNIQFINRMFNSLIYAYDKLSKPEKVEELKQLQSVLKNRQ